MTLQFWDFVILAVIVAIFSSCGYDTDTDCLNGCEPEYDNGRMVYTEETEGPAGSVGRDGRDGADGSPGPAGPGGVAGAPGTAGVDGRPGEPGAPGEAGPAGAGCITYYINGLQQCGVAIECGDTRTEIPGKRYEHRECQ